MKAVVCTKYGSPDVLEFREVNKPVPGKNDVLIKVHASTVTMGDCELRSLTLPLWTRVPMRLMMGYSKPTNFIPGMEMAGVVEEVGKEVRNLKPGDVVFGSTGMAMGGNAEYKCRSAKAALAIKPAELSFSDAATIPVGGINALHFLRMANIQPGQKVLIIGAGGCIGTYGVQLAKHYGAEVTAVDKTEKIEALRAFGADHTIDFTKETFSASGEKYDVIFDLVYGSSYEQCVHALTPRGVYLMGNSGPRRMIKGWIQTQRNGKRIYSALAAEKTEDLDYLASLIVSGRIKPAIDKTFPLSKTHEAHAFVDSGRKFGSVVIEIGGPGAPK